MCMICGEFRERPCLICQQHELHVLHGPILNRRGAHFYDPGERRHMAGTVEDRILETASSVGRCRRDDP